MGVVVGIRAASSVPIKPLFTNPNSNSNSNSSCSSFLATVRKPASSPSSAASFRCFSMASSSSSSSPTTPIEASKDSSLDVSSSSVVGVNDLLIVGPGVLGRIIAKMWQQEYPGCKIFGQTMSSNHHSELAELGIVPHLRGSPLSQKVPYVIFCAPPSRTEDYPGDVRIAASNWNGIVDARPDHILNIIHYEDAASLSIAIMKKKLHSCIFVGCDNHPLSRQEIMDLVNRSGKFSKKFEAFTGTDGPLGKKMNTSKTREEIGLEPKYPSFPAFLGLKD